jgi:hypothetical protein
LGCEEETDGWKMSENPERCPVGNTEWEVKYKKLSRI